MLILAIALLGLNLLTGFNGQISLGHGAFFALGGYGAAILIVKFGFPYWAADPACGRSSVSAPASCSASRRCGSAASISRSRPSRSRSRRRNCAYKGFDAWTGGSQGLQLGKPHAPFGLPLTPTSGSISSASPAPACLFWAASNLVGGRVGRAIVAIRDQPVAAETMGVNIAFYKATCFGVSALYAGVAGALGAIVVGFVSPESFGLSCRSLLVGIVVGGLASIRGVLFGALFIEFVPNFADQRRT